MEFHFVRWYHDEREGDLSSPSNSTYFSLLSQRIRLSVEIVSFVSSVYLYCYFEADREWQVSINLDFSSFSKLRIAITSSWISSKITVIEAETTESQENMINSILDRSIWLFCAFSKMFKVYRNLLRYEIKFRFCSFFFRLIGLV